MFWKIGFVSGAGQPDGPGQNDGPSEVAHSVAGHTSPWPRGWAPPSPPCSPDPPHPKAFAKKKKVRKEKALGDELWVAMDAHPFAPSEHG